MWLASACANFNVMREASLAMSVPLSKTESRVSAVAYSHSSIKSARDLVVLLQSWAATQDLRQPELADRTLHMPYPSLSWRRRFDPLRWFSSHSRYHISMRECLGCPLIRLYVERRRYGLCDTGVEGGGSTWDHKRVFAMVACDGSLSIPVPSPRSSRTGGEGFSE